MIKCRPKFPRQADILHVRRLNKQRRNLIRLMACSSASDRYHEEQFLRMGFRIPDEPVDVWLDIGHITERCRYGVASALRSLRFSGNGAKLICGKSGGAPVMEPGDVGTLCKRLHKAPYVKPEVM